ncbi:hypothetical protein CJ030_MR4G003053 [Morella rubra]|uniref:Uncharacterized protein n=1 Tax=Morella rubra TaxID=262757 RepID=A0A6A1VWQ9_9ROSI|nr:hypothetical protein CJ030_MR4G003053 [Morella rubra]
MVQSLKCIDTNEVYATSIVSARIKDKQRTMKELLICRRIELLDENAYQEKAKEPMAKTDKGFKVAAEQMYPSLEINDRVGSESAAATTFEKSENAKVKETLRLFNKYYLYFVHEKEKRNRAGSRVRQLRQLPKAPP